MPVIPSKITNRNWRFLNGGNLRSDFHVAKIRKIEAIANLKKAMEKGLMFRVTYLPAMKVPPQNSAVMINFK
jgi:hypothetical protein